MFYKSKVTSQIRGDATPGTRCESGGVAWPGPYHIHVSRDVAPAFGAHPPTLPGSSPLLSSPPPPPSLSPRTSSSGTITPNPRTPVTPPPPGARKIQAHRQAFSKGMAHDEAVATQRRTGKTGSPPKDQPAPCPYPDWSAMQAYYGHGVLPPPYFAPAMAPGHPPPPYMWGPQPMMPPPFGTPYAAMYPHGGAYTHPLMPMMANPLSVEPAKSASSKDRSSNKKLKEIDGSAVSTGSGNSKKTSSSGDYSGEGSSDVNDMKVSGTPTRRSLDGGLDTEPNSAGRAKDVLTPIMGNGAILPNQCFPSPVIKPTVTNVATSRAIGTPVSPLPGVMIPTHTGISTELSSKDEREVKREKRKQSNRESARRSRLRKQAETEELAIQVESLTAENTSLRSEIGKLTKSSDKLRLENSALVVKLKDTAPPTNAEMPLDKPAAVAASSSPRIVENFLSIKQARCKQPHGAQRAQASPAPRLQRAHRCCGGKLID